jgi:hypothetical protein
MKWCPKLSPVDDLVTLAVHCSPSLDHHCRLFPASFGQRRPSTSDRSTSEIGTLLPIALWSRSSL